MSVEELAPAPGCGGGGGGGGGAAPPLLPLTPVEHAARFARIIASLRSLRVVKDELHPEAWRIASVFEEPVDESVYTDYRERVAVPICLGDVAARAGAGAYGVDAAAFRADLLLIGDNCAAYNAGNGYWTSLARIWKAQVEKDWGRFVDEPDAKRVAAAARTARRGGAAPAASLGASKTFAASAPAGGGVALTAFSASAAQGGGAAAFSSALFSRGAGGGGGGGGGGGAPAAAAPTQLRATGSFFSLTAAEAAEVGSGGGCGGAAPVSEAELAAGEAATEAAALALLGPPPSLSSAPPPASSLSALPLDASYAHLLLSALDRALKQAPEVRELTERFFERSYVRPPLEGVVPALAFLTTAPPPGEAGSVCDDPAACTLPPAFTLGHLRASLRGVAERRPWATAHRERTVEDTALYAALWAGSGFGLGGAPAEATYEVVEVPPAATVGDAWALVERVLHGVRSAHSRRAWEGAAGSWPPEHATAYAQATHMQDLMRAWVVEYFGDYAADMWAARRAQRAAHDSVRGAALTARTKAVLLRAVRGVAGQGEVRNLIPLAAFFTGSVVDTFFELFKKTAPTPPEEYFTLLDPDTEPSLNGAACALASAPEVPQDKAAVAWALAGGEGGGGARAPPTRAPGAPYTHVGHVVADVEAALRRPGEYLLARARALAAQRARGGAPDPATGLLLSPTPGAGATAEFTAMAEAGRALGAEWTALWATAALSVWDLLTRARILARGLEDAERAAARERDAQYAAAQAKIAAAASGCGGGGGGAATSADFWAARAAEFLSEQAAENVVRASALGGARGGGGGVFVRELLPPPSAALWGAGACAAPALLAAVAKAQAAGENAGEVLRAAARGVAALAARVHVDAEAEAEGSAGADGVALVRAAAAAAAAAAAGTPAPGLRSAAPAPAPTPAPAAPPARGSSSSSSAAAPALQKPPPVPLPGARAAALLMAARPPL
jgi:hypothetical protein